MNKSKGKSQSMVVHVPSDTHKQLKVYCQRTGRKMSYVVTEAVVMFLMGKSQSA